MKHIKCFMTVYACTRRVQPAEGGFSERSPLRSEKHNITFGLESPLLKRCPELYEYAMLVDALNKARESSRIREEQEKAATAVIDDFIERDILREFLLEYREDIVERYFWEYDEEAAHRAYRLDGYEDGVAEERANTERERRRADDAEQRVDDEKQRADSAEKLASEEKARADSAEQLVSEEKRRADSAEAEVQALRAELAQLKAAI